MWKNTREKRLIILEYFDAYICDHYQPKKKNVVKNNDGNICIEIFQNYWSFLSDIFRH